MANRISLAPQALLTIILVACAPAASVPTAGPHPSAPSPAPRLQGEVSAPVPSAEQLAYAGMAIVAMKPVRLIKSNRIVGMYQSDDPAAPLYPIVKAVLETHPFKEIHTGDTKLACTPAQRSGLRGNTARSPNCGLDIADVLVQITSVQIMRDSGYVGGYFTEVERGQDRPKNTAFCFMTAWRDGAWTEPRVGDVRHPRDCTSGKKH